MSRLIRINLQIQQLKYLYINNVLYQIFRLSCFTWLFICLVWVSFKCDEIIAPESCNKVVLDTRPRESPYQIFSRSSAVAFTNRRYSLDSKTLNCLNNTINQQHDQSNDYKNIIILNRAQSLYSLYFAPPHRLRASVQRTNNQSKGSDPTAHFSDQNY